MRSSLTLVVTLTALLTGCNDFPQLNDGVDDATRDAKYPKLVPVETIQARFNNPLIDEDISPELEARVARLKARANRLRGGVVDQDTRERFKAGVE